MITDKQVDVVLNTIGLGRSLGHNIWRAPMRRALEAADRAAWQPMESAPKGCDLLFQWEDDPSMLCGSIHSDEFIHYSGGSVDTEHFSAWRHLPGGPGR